MLVDGLQLRKVALNVLRRQAVLFGRNVVQCGGGLSDNIAYGRLGPSDAQIRDAADQAPLAPMRGYRLRPAADRPDPDGPC